MSANKLAGAVRSAIADGQMRAGDSIRMGEVAKVSPLEIEVMDTGLVLDDEILDFSASASVYMELNALATGDVCVIAYRDDDVDGTWVVLDFLDDSPTIPAVPADIPELPPGTMALWYGSAPSGWLGCNGNTVTPGGGRDALRTVINGWGSPWGSVSGDPRRPDVGDMPTAAPLDWIIKL